MNFIRSLFTGSQRNTSSNPQQSQRNDSNNAQQHQHHTSNNTQQSSSSRWSLTELINRYGLRVQSFLENLSNSIEESQRQVQEEMQRQREQSTRNAQQFYMMSGLPMITGNPYLDQLIMLSNHQHLHGNVNFGIGGLQFSFGFNPMVDELTMEEILTTAFQQSQQNNTTPTDQRVLQTIPIIRLTKERLDFKRKLSESIESHTCSICIEDYSEDEQLVQLPCEHIFHKDCIMPWIEQHNTCPTCRYELPLTDPFKERERLQRMRERFTEEGLQIMQIANEDNTIFDKLYDIRIQIANAKGKIDNEYKNKLQANLSSYDSFLGVRMSKLDSMGHLQNDQVRHNRKNEILKIQFLQDRIDAMRKEIESSGSNS